MLKDIIKKVHHLTTDQQADLLKYLQALPVGGERGYPRKRARLDIDAVSGEKVIQSDTRDISASGVFINVAGRFEKNKAVQVVFSLPAQERPFKLQGEIIRVEKNGIAIQFNEVSPYFTQILDKAIWE